MRVSALLLHWELPLGTYYVGFNYLFIFPPGYVALWVSKAHHRFTGESVSWCLETSLFFKTPFPGWIFWLSFYFVYFVLPPFEDNGLPFWVPDVLCLHSEIVLWNFLSVQMLFWWICWGESGLHILFLQHLRTGPQKSSYSGSDNIDIMPVGGQPPAGLGLSL